MTAVAIQVNGRERRVPEGATVADLLAELVEEPRAVAVERNGEIVARERRAAVTIEAGDRLEIVRFVQGG